MRNTILLCDIEPSLGCLCKVIILTDTATLFQLMAGVYSKRLHLFNNLHHMFPRTGNILLFTGKLHRHIKIQMENIILGICTENIAIIQ